VDECSPWFKEATECPVCLQKVAAARFAQHLERCMVGGGIQSRHSNDVTLCFDEPSPVHTSVCAFVHPEVKSCPDISSSACSQLKLQRGLVKHTM
jgi:hypothetical protein